MIEKTYNKLKTYKKTLYINVGVYEKIKNIADTHGMSLSLLINKILKYYVDNIKY